MVSQRQAFIPCGLPHSKITPRRVRSGTGNAASRFRRRHVFGRHLSCGWICMRNSEARSVSDSDSSFATLEADIREYLERCPDSEKSPLAYVTLRKAGRVDLISRIMDAGGYIKVSRRLGIPIDETQFIQPPELSPFDSAPPFTDSDGYNASLSIGRDLEAKLNTIETVIKDTQNLKNVTNAIPTPTRLDDVPTGEELRMQNESIVPPVVDKQTPAGERLALTLPMRFGMLVLCASCALGFGRTSHGILHEDLIASCRSLTYGLGLAHVVLGFYAGTVMAPQMGRSSPLWFFKVLLSGPLGLRHMRALGPIEEREGE